MQSDTIITEYRLQIENRVNRAAKLHYHATGMPVFSLSEVVRGERHDQASILQVTVTQLLIQTIEIPVNLQVTGQDELMVYHYLCS